MTLILNIETSGMRCSVALANEGNLLAEAISNSDNEHAAQLTNLIKRVLDEAHIEPDHLNAVAISAGPGSYTGLRIGTSTAKGLCHGLNIPLIAIDTLKAMAAGIATNNSKDLLFCPLIDAKRMEVFTGVYDSHGEEIQAAGPFEIDHNSFRKLLENNRILFFGSGLAKCIPLLDHKHSLFNETHIHTAKFMLNHSFEKFMRNDFASVAYFEPAYLKAVYTTTPGASNRT